MFWRGVAFLGVLAVFWRDMTFWRRRGACSVLEGHDILEEVLAMFWRGVAFLERCLQCFGGMWHFGGACNVLEGCGILEGCLQCFGGMWHFGGACNVLEGVTFLRRCLQCFGGAL